MNELMMTGWLLEVGEMRGCRQAFRSRVGSEIGRPDLGGREGVGGRWRGRRALKSKAKKELATNYTIRIVYFGENSTKLKRSVDRNT